MKITMYKDLNYLFEEFCDCKKILLKVKRIPKLSPSIKKQITYEIKKIEKIMTTLLELEKSTKPRRKK